MKNIAKNHKEVEEWEHLWYILPIRLNVGTFSQPEKMENEIATGTKEQFLDEPSAKIFWIWIMNTIRLCRREIERIKELFDTIHTTGNVGFVTLTQHDEESGIGYELRATFQITHKNTDGDFVVTITDHRDW